MVRTHALYAYETAAGVLIPDDAMATQDVDLLFDSRKRVKFFTKMQRLDSSFLSIHFGKQTRLFVCAMTSFTRRSMTRGLRWM